MSILLRVRSPSFWSCSAAELVRVLAHDLSLGFPYSQARLFVTGIGNLCVQGCGKGSCGWIRSTEMEVKITWLRECGKPVFSVVAQFDKGGCVRTGDPSSRW
jgi:hypothetical protein